VWVGRLLFVRRLEIGHGRLVDAPGPRGGVEGFIFGFAPRPPILYGLLVTRALPAFGLIVALGGEKADAGGGAEDGNVNTRSKSSQDAAKKKGIGSTREIIPGANISSNAGKKKPPLPRR